jgi:DNA polymerase-3 subunit alpha
MYINVHSYYSLRFGTLSPEQLAGQAVKNGVTSMVLTDINNSTGIFDFVKACRGKDVRPLAGMEYRRGDRLLFIGIARNNEGFRELNEWLSLHSLNKKSLPDRAPEFENVFVVYPFGKKLPDNLRPNEWIGVKPSDLSRLATSPYARDPRRLVARQPVTFTGRAGYFLHRHLRAIDKNILLSQLRPEFLASPDEIMLSTDELNARFRDCPLILQNTGKLLAACSFDFDFTSVKNKKSFTGSRQEDHALLEKLALDGLRYRYGPDNWEAKRRIYQELEIIFKLGFAAYFLIAWDVIRYSLSNGIYHVGRGSGANSVVAYCLKITDVDPIELNLYFERFINPKRTSPPDFDIDYSWKDRDQVQDYIFKRFGKKHTALLGAMSTFKGKSIYRELGKVYGLPKAETDAFIANPLASSNRDQVTSRIIEVSKMMTDFPNLRSIHAGGILISEEPITSYTALDMPPKGFPTTQWDMYVGEDIGFEKLDILSQRGLGHIDEAISIIRDNQAVTIDCHQVERFKQDAKVKTQLRSGETTGCFYIESPAMRGLLKKLRCDNYLSLVAASSIIRPGVAKSGMMKEYIHRFHHPGKFRYLHPIMEEQLKETYGVMVYQEDVLKICHHFAGLDLADADVLRRVMSGKPRFKNEFKCIVNTFFANCKKRGYPEVLTREVWRQIESFAGYSFSKAHSASYAVESFQSLYLKAHYPLEFMVAVINNFGGFYRTWTYVNEARQCGGTIHPPCVNNGKYMTSIKGKDICLGFVHLANLEREVGQEIERESRQNGPFQGLEDFVARLPLGLEQMIILIRAGAFRFTGKSKPRLLWEIHMLLNKKPKNGVQKKLFVAPGHSFSLPELLQDKLEDAYDELELLGFPVSFSFFDMLQTSFRGETGADGMLALKGKKTRMLGQLVTLKYVRTVKKETMHFGCFLDAKGQFFDTVHFPPSLKKYPFRGDGVYLLYGKVVEEFGHPSLEVEKMAKMPLKEDPRAL